MTPDPQFPGPAQAPYPTAPPYVPGDAWIPAAPVPAAPGRRVNHGVWIGLGLVLGAVAATAYYYLGYSIPTYLGYLGGSRVSLDWVAIAGLIVAGGIALLAVSQVRRPAGAGALRAGLTTTVVGGVLVVGVAVFDVFVAVPGLIFALVLAVAGIVTMIVSAAVGTGPRPSTATPVTAPIVGYTPGGFPIHGQPWPVPPRGTNTSAILALVFGFTFPLVAIPLGHVALSQIKRTGEEGTGLAVTGLVLGYLSLIAAVVGVVVLVAVLNSSGY